MSNGVRIFIVAIIGAWMLGTLIPQLGCVWSDCPDNGLFVDFDGIVSDVSPDSPAAKAAIVPGDRIAVPFPRELFRQPPQSISLTVLHDGASRRVTVAPVPSRLSETDRLRLLALCVSYFIFLVVGSAVLLLRPSPMTWVFYLYCVLRRFGDLSFFWPGSSAFFWFNMLTFATLGGASCALVTMFALRFPSGGLAGWRLQYYRVAIALAALFPAAWLYVFIRVIFLGLPSQSLVDAMVKLTSIVYLGAAVIFVATLIQSHGEERHRLRWILVFPVVLLIRIIAINLPYSMPLWFSDALIVLAVCVPLAVAYAVVQRRVFDIQFAISRALVYGAITSIVAGTFLILDWFMSKQFAETRFTLTAEIVVALALGSWLTMLHRSVDRFVDSTFFRQRHQAEQRLAKAASALVRAESYEAVDRFLAHEPVQALDLASAALFRRNESAGHFVRKMEVGWAQDEVKELTADHPLVMHLLSEGAPVRLADVRWSADDLTNAGNAVLAMPVLLRDELVTIVLYGPHRAGTDIDPDEVRSLVRLAESAGAAYDHIEARKLRAEIESLMRERELKDRQIEELRARANAHRPSTAPGF